MKRGNIWTVAGGKDYAGKPRPVAIVQDDRFDATDSIMICAFTTDETDAPLLRLAVEPNERHGFQGRRLMVDKITTVPKSKLGAQFGRLDDKDVERLNRAMLVFLVWQCLSKQNLLAHKRFPPPPEPPHGNATAPVSSAARPRRIRKPRPKPWRC